MGPPSYMRYAVDRNVVMRRMTVVDRPETIAMHTAATLRTVK